MQQKLIDRVPPQNVDAERAVLGAMMGEGSKQAISAVLEIVSADHFYREAHKAIFSAVASMFVAGSAVDLVTITEALEKRGDLEKVGGVPALDEMIDSCPTWENVTYYAEIVYQEWKRRRLIRIGASITRQSYDETVEVDDLLNTATEDILAIRNRESQQVKPLGDGISKALKHVQAIQERGDGMLGFSSGFVSLDAELSGLQTGQFILVGGRPSMGKSVFVQSVAQNVARSLRGVLLFSLEMDLEQVALRILAAESEVSYNDLRSGTVKDMAWPGIVTKCAALAEKPFYIDDRGSLSIGKMWAKAHQMKATDDIELVIVDYLQLVQGDKLGNREQEISSISRSLKALAKDLKVAVIGVSQLSRSVEERKDKRPQLRHLRESGSLEQDADVVLFLYRENYYNRLAETSTTELIIAKQRNGATGVVELEFRPQIMKFIEI